MKKFEKQHNVQVNITTFENEEEALAKLTSGQASFDVWLRPSTPLARGGREADPAAQPLLSPEPGERLAGAAEPVLRPHSRYTVPYTVYTTGIAWRKDKVKKAPADYAQEPRTTFSGIAGQYAGKVAILDDPREAIAMALLQRGILNVNTEEPRSS